jgi:hypothetical protein
LGPRDDERVIRGKLKLHPSEINHPTSGLQCFSEPMRENRANPQNVR